MTVDYTTLAGAVWDATGAKADDDLSRAPTLTSDELDAIMQTCGISAVRRSGPGRTDWLTERQVHRSKLNRWLREKREATLEVVGHKAGGQRIYGVVRAKDTLIDRPFRIGTSFYNQIEHHLDAISRMLQPNAAIRPPAGLDADKLDRYNILNRRRIERLIAEYFDSIEMHTLQAGFEVPDLPEKIVNLREERTRRRKRKAS